MAVVITASVPLLEPPLWAIAQRELFALLDEAWRRFEADYTLPDGRLDYRHTLTTRDGVDDFYEVFFNWPQLYLLGGADDLLEASERHWEGVTAQLTELGMLKDEYERGYDWFHQSESLLLLYFLCMANPARWRERALRFADLYVEPAHGNYDPAHHIITRPHNGTDPRRTGLFDGPHYPWLPKEADLYGYPLDWLLPEHAPTPERAADPRLSGEMTRRLGVGDTAVNLAATGLVHNAWILSGDERYRDWITAYVGAWRQRAAANHGIIPDNVAPDGTVGGLLDGRWYGGHYGWSWPHGWYSVGHAAIVAALAAAHTTGRHDALDLVRPALDEIIAHGKTIPYTAADSSLPSKWHAQLAQDIHTPTLHVPYRHSDKGWFDYNPLLMGVPTALWHHSASDSDWARIQHLRAASGHDWRTVRAFRSKEEAGHEEPWLAYLAGDNPTYPETILTAAQAQIRHRLARMTRYRGTDVPEADIHLWQQSNPVVTEALVQLTWGGPQVIYNGGLQQARLRHYDTDTRRPGLPPHVAALVSDIHPHHTTLELINLDPTHPHTVTTQAGAFAEHTITTATHTHDPHPTTWIGDLYDYGHHTPHPTTTPPLTINHPHITTHLPPSTRITITLQLNLHTNTPTYNTPFDA